MSDGGQASGFPCPCCGQSRLAEVERIAPPQVELRCPECGWRWAAET